MRSAYKMMVVQPKDAAADTCTAGGGITLKCSKYTVGMSN